MPQAVIEQLSAAVREATRQPDVRQHLIGISIEPVGKSPQAFKTFLTGQIAR